ncbi:MAG: nitroreductase [Xanthomonadales bacterium]|nr:putative NAD(P)H nitroreductase YdjA [Xanthomonadales bacterium]MCC6593366.1 nitroreductase [Xanthomonadales bacterium]MCE7930641.1 nitroreductase [Xanthomonadales bacterium PRO6]
MSDPRLQLLNTRHSTPAKALGPPAPEGTELHALIEAAARVPDHGRLRPWRLLEIRRETGLDLGRRLVALREARGETLDETTRHKDLHRFAHAPLVLVVIARIAPGHKIPEVEQLLSAGALAQNLLLGAHALGYAAQWLTGWPAHDADVAPLLGLHEHERIIAFVHVGTPTAIMPDRERPAAGELLRVWQPPGG